MKKKGLKGFAALSIEERKEIASRGGKAAQKNGHITRFKKGSAKAREAGKKGGSVKKNK